MEGKKTRSRGIDSFFPVLGQKRSRPMDQAETEDASRATETRVDSGDDRGPETVDTPRNSVHGDDDTAASSSSDRAPLSHSSRMSISSSSKHKQGKYDPEWERMYPWVYQSEDGKGMFCRLCKRFNTRNERNSFAVFNMTPCVSLRKDVLARHADSSMHKSAMMQEHDRLASQQGGGIEQAFSKAISIEKKAALGAMKCLYWLAKNEIAHTTRYVPLLELVRSLGCSYFDSLQVGGNATYTSERMIQEFIQNMSSQIETGLLQELRNSPCVALMCDETTDVSVLKQMVIYGRY